MIENPIPDEIVQQLKSIVREAVSETIDVKMALWQLRKEYEQNLQMQVEMERRVKNLDNTTIL